MTREEQLVFCTVCKKRAFDPKHGIVCGITDQVATFTTTCPDFEEDTVASNQVELRKENTVNETNTTINKARNTLLVIGGVYVLLGFYEAYFVLGHQLLYGIIDWGIAAVFIGLGIWSYSKAYLALIAGLCFYILLVILFALADPLSIFSGLLWKFLILSYLIYGIKTARNEKGKITAKSTDLLDQL